MRKVTAMAMTRKAMNETEYLGRRAMSAMIDAICQTSPSQAAFRDAGRQYSELSRRLFELRAAGEDTGSISDQMIACGERLIELVDLIDWQWRALFDWKAGAWHEPPIQAVRRIAGPHC
jgi:hypothetical protein